MSFVLEDETKPTSCAVTTYHVPDVVRFIWHHIQCKEAGGQTVSTNLVNLCDNCHYTIHRMMWYMAQQYLGTTLTSDQQNLLDHPPRKAQLAIAEQGFNLCVSAGTVDQIPDEG